MKPKPPRQHPLVRFAPLKITLIYAIPCVLYIFLSDTLVHALVKDPVAAKHISIAKGAGFVFVTAWLIFVLTRRATRLLGRSEAKFRKLIDRSPLPIAIVSDNGRIESFNRRFVESFGYTLEDTPTEDAWWRRAYPDTTYREEVRQRWHRLVQQADATGSEIPHGEYDITTKRGEMRTVIVYGSRADGKILVVFDDITDRRRAEEAQRIQEERNRLVIQASTDGIWDWDLATDEVYFSARWKEMLGYADDELENRLETWQRVIFPEDRAGVEQLIQAHFEHGDPFHHISRYHHKDGSTRWIQVHGVAIRDADGKPIRMIGSQTDITAEHLLQQRLRQAEKLRAIGQLAGGVAHDFNNQLGGIVGNAELLLLSLRDAEDREYVQRILTASRRASDLTRDLLAFARKGNYPSVPVDVHPLIHEVVAILERSVDKRIDLKQDLRAETRLVKGDPTQLQSAILNLALNARDAMPDGGELRFATSTVTLEEKAFEFDIQAGRYLCVTVTDTGVGMDAETKQRLFEPFFTTKQVGEGTGLGMAAVYGTVKNHRGAISVYSELGHGTAIKLYLPILEDEGQIVSNADKATGYVKGSARILLVDDEPLLRDVASQMLQAMGHTVTVCEDGETAIEKYRDSWQDVDLVILDMVMPKMGGREVFLALREINPKIRALLSSGYALGGEAQSILDEGVAGFLQKPFTLAGLSQEVAKVLQEA